MIWKVVIWIEKLRVRGVGIERFENYIRKEIVVFVFGIDDNFYFS